MQSGSFPLRSSRVPGLRPGYGPDGAEFFSNVIRKGVVTEKGLHAETLVASAARMAGTLLLQSSSLISSSFVPETHIISKFANVEGPKMIGLLLTTLKSLNPSLGDNAFSNLKTALETGSSFTLAETQKRLLPSYLAYSKAAKLSQREAGYPSVITTALLIKDCAEVLDVNKAAGIAVRGFIEGIKTGVVTNGLVGVG